MNLLLFVSVFTSLSFAILEGLSGSFAQWGSQPDLQRSMKFYQEAKNWVNHPNAREREGYSWKFKLSAVVSIASMLVAAVISFYGLGFSWLLLAVAVFFATVRSSTVAFIVLVLGKDTAPLPKWFDATMYETLGFGALIMPTLIIGTITALI